MFRWSIDQLPAGEGPYQVTIGSRPVAIFDETALRADKADITVGR